ncbi:unnamed protein product [Urochloa humidicola]
MLFAFNPAKELYRELGKEVPENALQRLPAAQTIARNWVEHTFIATLLLATTRLERIHPCDGADRRQGKISSNTAAICMHALSC